MGSLVVVYHIGCFQKTNCILNFSKSKNPGSGAKYCETYVGTKGKNYFILCASWTPLEI